MRHRGSAKARGERSHRSAYRALSKWRTELPAGLRFKPVQNGAIRHKSGSSPAGSSGSSVRFRQKLEKLKQDVGDLISQIKQLQGRIDRLEPGVTGEDARTGGKKHAVVDELKCTGCGMCENICPYGAVKVTNIAHVDTQACAGCGLCVERCPRGALRLS